MKLKWVIVAICICIVAILWGVRKKPQVSTIRPTPMLGVSVKMIEVSRPKNDTSEAWMVPMRLADDGVLLYGHSDRDANGMAIEKHDGLVMKVDQRGRTVWSKRYRTTGYDDIDGARQYPNGDIFLFGNLGLSYTDKENPKAVEFRTRLTKSGRQVWMKQQPCKVTMTTGILDCSNDGVLMGNITIGLVDNKGNEKWHCSPNRSIHWTIATSGDTWGTTGLRSPDPLTRLHILVQICGALRMGNWRQTGKSSIIFRPIREQMCRNHL